MTSCTTQRETGSPAPAKTPTSEPNVDSVYQLISGFLLPLIQMIKQLDERLSQFCDAVAMLERESRRRGEASKLADVLAERAQKLEERHHEREVLRPVFLTVIGLIDRAREERQALAAAAAQHARARRVDASRACEYLAKARATDISEFESALQLFGVHAYQTPGPRFDPATQTPVGRVALTNGQPPGDVAARRRPGYRRENTIIRPEYVTVYAQPEPDTAKEGVNA
jgi:molecular chaperone GrpE (heat shock protein)